MRALIAYPLAILAGLLPKRHWEDVDLPVRNLAFASALLTFWAGAALGITGYFPAMEAALKGREFTAPPVMLAVFLGYVFATPRGLVSLYLLLSGYFRVMSWWVAEPAGDPLLTGLDALVHRKRQSRQQRSQRDARHALEGAEEPDRRYAGEWAGLSAVDYVIVSARRKPGWTKGTWVITNDGWFMLGEPFDRPMPNGLRTVYPLTLQTNSLEVLRKGVSYELPPLRKKPVNPANRLRQSYGGQEAGHHSNTEDQAQAGQHQQE